MKKIKRNEMIEKVIKLGAILPQIDGITASEVMDRAAEEYKENGDKNIFTSEETDAIMKALKSMAGYASEKLLPLGVPSCEAKNYPLKIFDWRLFCVYIMLSITNPELFEDYEEAEDGKDDTKD